MAQDFITKGHTAPRTKLLCLNDEHLVSNPMLLQRILSNF